MSDEEKALWTQVFYGSAHFGVDTAVENANKAVEAFRKANKDFS